MYVDQWRIQQEGIKEAINMPVQGAGGEVCKLGMIALHKKSAPMVLQIHDELLCEVPIEHAEEAMIVVQENMQSAKEKVMQLARPHSYIYLPPDFTASPHVGFSWEDAKGG